MRGFIFLVVPAKPQLKLDQASSIQQWDEGKRAGKR